MQRAVCVRKKKNEKICPTQNTPRNPQQPIDRDHLETARDETRHTRLPIPARFQTERSILCFGTGEKGNRLEGSENQITLEGAMTEWA